MKQRLIDADELIQRADEDPQFAVWEAGTGTLARLIDTMPIIDPESLRSRGHWERPSKLLNIVNCTACKTAFPGDFDEFRYCPHCGAKMEDWP